MLSSHTVKARTYKTSTSQLNSAYESTSQLHESGFSAYVPSRLSLRFATFKCDLHWQPYLGLFRADH